MTKHITETEFWHELMHGIYGPRRGGARIIIDAENAATGAAKTSLAVALARLLSRVFDYELQNEDFTLSGGQYLQRWRQHPGPEQPSVVVLDELSGAGAGDARRSMSNQNVNLGRSWQLMRKKRVVTITTLPHWSDADAKMRRFADYRLWCLEKPIGFFIPYKVGAHFSGGGEITRRLDKGRIGFPNMHAKRDPFYQHVTSLKDDLLDSEFFNADRVEGDIEDDEEYQKLKKEATKDAREELAQRLRDNGKTTVDIAELIGMSQSWVSLNTEAPQKVEAE